MGGHTPITFERGGSVFRGLLVAGVRVLGSIGIRLVGLEDLMLKASPLYQDSPLPLNRVYAGAMCEAGPYRVSGVSKLGKPQGSGGT